MFGINSQIQRKTKRRKQNAYVIPKPMETMGRITRQYMCDHFDEILERVDKEDIGFVILNEEGKDGEVLIPYRWTECFVDEDFGIVVNSALRYAIEKHSFMTAGVINFVRKNLNCLDFETIRLENESSVYAIFPWKKQFRKWSANNQIWKMEISLYGI